MTKPVSRMGQGLLGYFVRHSTAANLILLVMIILGLLLAPRMRTQFFPDVTTDTINVSVIWEGAGAEDIDAGIIQVLEPSLLAIDGVETSTSTSSEGRANIVLSFEPGTDIARAANDAQTVLDQADDLPEQAEDPEIRQSVWYDRVTDVVITGDVSIDQLSVYADEFVARLFQKGVTRTAIRGIADPNVLVEVRLGALAVHDLTMRDIATAIGSEIDSTPAGDISGVTSRVRTGVKKRTPAELADIVLRSNDDGSKLTLGDVARIIPEGVDRERAYFVGDLPAISLRVDRSAQGDALKIQAIVEEVAETLESTLPKTVSITLIRTRSEAISGRLQTLLDNGIAGLGLVVLLLFLFLNARTAFWVAAGIPVAMLSALSLMYFAGLTINMISLFALIITLGIVVDDAIVVGEHADTRARRYGEPAAVAAERAAQRMWQPVFTATLTTIIAFFGLTAIGGRFGSLIVDIPFTVIAVLLASLIECFLILPNHMAHALKHQSLYHWYDWPSRTVHRGFCTVRERLFRPFVHWVIRLRYPVLSLAVLILASQISLFISGDVVWRFFNAPERGSITGNFIMAPDATRQDSMDMMHELQRATDDLAAEYEKRHGLNPVEFVLAEIGGNAGFGLSAAESTDPDLLGGISIELIDPDLRPYSSFAFLGELQSRIVEHPKVETVSFRGSRSGPGGDSISVELVGESPVQLKAASERLKQMLMAYPEVSAVDDNLQYDKQEVVLELTPQGRALGFTTAALGQTLRDHLNGIEAASYPEGPRSATITVDIPETEKQADFIESMLMRTPQGNYVPLSDIVGVTVQSGFSRVLRENGLRVVTVTGDLTEDDPVRAAEIMTKIEDELLPQIASLYQVDYRLSGLAEQEDDFLKDAKTGLILALTGIYLALAWVFSSWTRPVVVMAIIPFGLVGTIFGHYAWDVPLSMFSVIGFIGLVGIIVNDSIVLVTTIDEQAETKDIRSAVIDGTVDRLRPVMLTTMTTVFGLAPLLFERAQQAQFLKPSVITLVYGLGFGLMLVLTVIPALIVVQRDLAVFFKAFQRALSFRQKRLRSLYRAGVAGVLLWFAYTVGTPAITGRLPDMIERYSPIPTSADPVLTGLVFYCASLSLVAILGLVLLVLSTSGSGAKNQS